MADVNAILAAALTDVTTTDTVNNEFLLILADRVVLVDHPALFKIDDIDGRRTNVVKVPHIDLMGTALPSPAGDGASVANTPVNNSSSTVAVTRQTQAYGRTDLAGIVAGDTFNATAFAMNAVLNYQLVLVELVTDIIDDFAGVSGISGQDLDVATWLGAAGATRVGNVQGSLLGIIHGQQWSDLTIDIGAAVGGTTQNDPTAHAQATSAMPTGWQGRVLGVDTLTSNRVRTANAGADYAGGIFGRGGVLWGQGTPQVEIPALQTLIGDRVLYELDRHGRSGETAYVSHAYLGASKGLEAGTTLISDA
jgi:hypothetical protein